MVGGSPGSSGGRAFQARRAAMSARGLAGLLVCLQVRDQIAVAHRVVIDGELKYPIEQHRAATGTAPIETEHELVEVVSQVRVVDGALMGCPAATAWPARRPGGPRAGARRDPHRVPALLAGCADRGRSQSRPGRGNPARRQ